MQTNESGEIYDLVNSNINPSILRTMYNAIIEITGFEDSFVILPSNGSNFIISCIRSWMEKRLKRAKSCEVMSEEVWRICIVRVYRMIFSSKFVLKFISVQSYTYLGNLIGHVISYILSNRITSR